MRNTKACAKNFANFKHWQNVAMAVKLRLQKLVSKGFVNATALRRKSYWKCRTMTRKNATRLR